MRVHYFFNRLHIFLNLGNFCAMIKQLKAKENFQGTLISGLYLKQVKYAQPL